MEGFVHSMETFGLVDGPGVRFVVFLQGCRMRCRYCHNPETWKLEGGTPWTADKLFSHVYRYKSYWNKKGQPNGGITVSGGEPLHPANHVEVAVLAKEIKETFPNKTIWLYTGFCWDEIKTLDVVKYCDVIVDGPFVQEEFDGKLHWKGSKNQRVIDVQETLRRKEIVLCEF